ncbi:MAG: alkaline phosphatase family protein [Gemmataceae bacterium]|nr:alkaline phosphatase family protein [Gemmataceae bacterium]
MSAPRFARVLLLLSPALLLLATVGFVILKPTAPANSVASGPIASTGGGKLVVLAVFDQLRGDYLERWKQHFGSAGFERMKRDGAWFSNVRLPYSGTSTAPGHASLLTGAPPSVHGIVENRWFDRSLGQIVAAATLDGVARVPADETATRERWPGLSPKRLLAPTVGDALKAQAKNGRVFSLALKDRAAVLMGGQDPDGAYCFDSGTGEFHTSAHYRDKLPGWVDEFDRSRVVYRWAGKTWDRFGPLAAYDALGADDVAGEASRTHGGRRTFPYPLGTPDDRTRNHFAMLEASPFGNELLWEFAKAAIAGEKLGSSGTPDLLCLGFSANDLLGHDHGPDSHEVLDITLRSDKLVADMIAHLDATVGPGGWTLVVTADHGVGPLPEVAVRTDPDAKRIGLADLYGGLDQHLDKVFGTIDGVPGQWIELGSRLEATYPWLYLNRRLIDAHGLKTSEVEVAAASWLRERPTPLAVLTRSTLESGDFASETEKKFGPLVQKSFHPARCGDIAVVPPPHHLVLGALSTGTDHGSPHDYDRHIPILAIGAGIPKLGERKEMTSSLTVAPLLSKLLGIDPPKEAKEPLPAELK